MDLSNLYSNPSKRISSSVPEFPYPPLLAPGVFGHDSPSSLNIKVQAINKKTNLHYTGEVMPTRGTSGEAHLRSLAPGNTAPKHYRSSGESLTTLSSLSPTRVLNPCSPARIAMCSTTTPTDLYRLARKLLFNYTIQTAHGARAKTENKQGTHSFNRMIT